MTFGDWELADFEQIREEAGSGSAPSDGLRLYREEYLIEFMLKDQVDVNAFGTAYGAADFPAQGPAKW